LHVAASAQAVTVPLEQRAPSVALVAEPARAKQLEALIPGRVACTFADVEQAIAGLAGEAPPSAVVVDVPELLSPRAPLIARLVQALAGAPVLIVCEQASARTVRAALGAGIAGLLTREDLGRALEPSLHAVLAGQVCVPDAHRHELNPPALSAREKQILGLVVMGYMNAQIARQLFLAESTVKSHLSSAFAKLGVRSRNEAVSIILDPERGYGLGILAVGAEPVPAPSSTTA